MNDKDTPTRVAFYLRVSTDEQAKFGFGLDFQKSDLESMLEYRGRQHNWIHDPSWVYIDDGYSGADLERPAYKKMLKDAKDGKFDLVAVWKIDRLSRSLTHLLHVFETLKDNGVSFLSVKENIDFSGAIGKLTFQIFGALAEFERETIKMRTSEGKNASARRGNYIISSPPFGYEKIETKGKITKTIRIIDNEAEWVKRIFDECLAGNTLNGIARMLNENKVPKGMGSRIKKQKYTPWYGTGIRDILEDVTYTGNAVYKPKNEKGEIEPIDIPVPQIIHPMVFEIAQNMLQEISENTKRGGGHNEYLLSGKVIDLTTGRSLIGYQRGKGGYGYRRKGFSLNGVSYPNSEIPGASLDDYVWGNIISLISKPEELFEVYKKQSIDDNNYDDLLNERRKKEIKLQESEGIEFTIEQHFLNGSYAEDKREKLINFEIEKRKALQKSITELDAKLDAIVRASSTKKDLELFGKNLDLDIKNLSFSQKKNLVSLLIEKIEVLIPEDTKKSRNNEPIVVKVNFRFGEKQVVKNGGGSNQKSPPLTDNLSKEGGNSEIWWECPGSNRGPSP